MKGRTNLKNVKTKQNKNGNLENPLFKRVIFYIVNRTIYFLNAYFI